MLIVKQFKEYKEIKDLEDLSNILMVNLTNYLDTLQKKIYTQMVQNLKEHLMVKFIGGIITFTLIKDQWKEDNMKIDPMIF